MQRPFTNPLRCSGPLKLLRESVPRYGLQRERQLSGAGHQGPRSLLPSPPVCPLGAALPNPSLNRSANGRPPGPVWRYAVHFRQPGPGVLPLSPA